MQKRKGKRPLDFALQFFYYVYKAGITQLVECKLPKLDAAGSSPVSRSKFIAEICLG
jgi:hypothetical protein